MSKSLLLEALSRIKSRGQGNGQAVIFIGGHDRFVRIKKDARGRPVDCSLFIDKDFNVFIAGSRDHRPIVEALPYETWKLADAIMTCLVYPEQVKQIFSV